MALNEARRLRPSKPFRIVLAFGFYRVGQVIYPTGPYRDALLQKGYIAPVLDRGLPEGPEQAAVYDGHLAGDEFEQSHELELDQDELPMMDRSAGRKRRSR